MALVTLWCIKLVAAVFAFSAIGYAGVRDKRLTGALLTFPILNGIALLTDPAPFVVADTIYAVVIFNSILFAFLISFGHRFTRGSGDRKQRIIQLVLVWGALWFAGAFFLTNRPAIINGLSLFVISATICVGFTWLAWTKTTAAAEDSSRDIRYFDFWRSEDKPIRILIFIGAFLILLVVSATLSSTWVGTFSAMPLPGLFALASLTVDTDDPKALRPIRNTVFWGPVLVIPFNFFFAAAVTRLDSASLPSLLGIPVLFGFWLVAFAIIYFLVRLLAPRLEHRSSP